MTYFNIFVLLQLYILTNFLERNVFLFIKYLKNPQNCLIFLKSFSWGRLGSLDLLIGKQILQKKKLWIQLPYQRVSVVE